MEAAGTELVDFVQHHHAVARAGLAQVLNDVAWQGANIGASMPADFCFVVDATEADAHEPAAGRFGDALPQRCFAHARWPNEAQDRAFARRVQLSHREIFEDALLHFLETEMILVQNAPRLGNVDGRFGLCGPGQFGQPIEVGAHHRRLTGAVGHPGETFEFLVRSFVDIGRHAGIDNRLLELVDFSGAFAAFAQLVLDDAHLLTQQVFAIYVANRRVCTFGDVARDFQHFNSAGEHQKQVVQARLQVEGFEQRLLVFRSDVQQARDHIGQLRRVGDAFQKSCHLGRRLRQQLKRFVRALFEGARPTFDFRGHCGGVVDILHAGNRERITFEVVQDAEATKASHDCPVRFVGCCQITQYRRAGADFVKIPGARVGRFGLPLQHHANRPFQAYGFLHPSLQGDTVDVERNDRSREQHVVANRKQDQRVVGDRMRAALRLRIGPCELRVDCRAGVDGQGTDITGFELGAHGCAIAILRSRTIRHPCSNSGEPSSMRPGGSAMRRSKSPWGISSLRTAWPRPASGSGRDPRTTSTPGSLMISIRSSVTPGIAMTITTSRSFS